MDFSLFIPETFLLLMALIFFCQSLWTSSAKTNQGLALFLSAIGLILSLCSLNLSGDLFYKSYRVDLFSQVFKILISLGLFLIIVLGQKFKSIEDRLQPEFFMFLSLSALGLMLMVSSVELVTIFIAMELSSYSLYVLIPIRKQTGGGQMEAAIKYIIFGAAATGVMIFGMSYIFGVTQSTYLVDILKKMPLILSQPVALIGLLLILCGFFFKLAVVPFQFWTPDVYQGAANETVSYVATMPKLAGVALLLRITSLAGTGAVDLIQVLVLLSALSMTFGNLAALVQKDLKRLLAYSSIAHAGYIMLGVLTLNALGYGCGHLSHCGLSLDEPGLFPGHLFPFPGRGKRDGQRPLRPLPPFPLVGLYPGRGGLCPGRYSPHRRIHREIVSFHGSLEPGTSGPGDYRRGQYGHFDLLLFEYRPRRLWAGPRRTAGRLFEFFQ